VAVDATEVAGGSCRKWQIPPPTANYSDVSPLQKKNQHSEGGNHDASVSKQPRGPASVDAATVDNPPTDK